MERLWGLLRRQETTNSPGLADRGALVRADHLVPTVAATAGSQNVDLYSTEGSIGMKVIAEPANTILDIVFVHGLTGNRDNTWTHKNGVFWPQQLADDMQNARIMTFGYDADVVKLWGMAGSNTLRHNGSNLAYAVSDRRRDCRSRPIIFITHSLGGLVCEQALVICGEGDKILEKVLQSTLGIIFMGTPHAGSDLAEWGYKLATYLNVVRKTNSNIVGVLKQRSEVLSAVQQQFQKLLQKDEVNIAVFCFFEEKAVAGVGTIVSQQSAVLNQFPCQSISANHMDMTKFSGKNDDGYQRVLGRVRDFTDLMNISTKRKRQSVEDGQRQSKRLKELEQPGGIDFQPSFPGQTISSSDSGTSVGVQKVECGVHINLTNKPREDVKMTLECHRAFRTSDYERFKERNPDPVAGTCQWFLQHYRYTSWRDSTISSLLWVSADPGCGKSVLSKYLSDKELYPTEKRATCYFFFKDDNEDQKTATHALCSLLHQLFTQRPTLIQYALEIYRDNGDALKKNFELLWKILITASTDPEAGEVIYILDALDECRESELKSLLQKLCRFYEKPPSPSSKFCMKFLVTSRPLQNIEGRFSKLSYKMPSIRLAGEEKTDQIKDEIDLVIDAELLSIQQEMELNTSTVSCLRDQITKIEHRTYLWLKLIFDLIRDDLQSVTKEGRQRIFGSIPDSVDACYTTILNKSTDKEQARNLLRIVCAAIRPLSVKEMAISLMITPDCKRHKDLEIQSEEYSARLIRNLCGLFVSVIDRKVYLLHQTAKEFLLSADDARESHRNIDYDNIWKHSISLRDSNCLLAEICMRYLRLKELQKRPSTMEDGFQKDAEGEIYWSSKVWAYKQSGYYLFGYAALNWATHFKEAKTPSGHELETLALELLNAQSPRMKNWLKFYWEMNMGPLLPAGLTNLHLASILGQESAVGHLLAIPGIELNTPDEDTFTPLHYAIVKGHEMIVAQLLAASKIEVNKTDGSGYSPLYKATFTENLTIVKQLIAAPGIEVHKPDNSGRTPLYEAMSGKNLMIFELLLACPGADVNKSDENGWTLLHEAVYRHNPAIVQRLLSVLGIDVNRTDRGGYTPLEEAVFRQDPKIVELLLAAPGINVNTRTANGETLLHKAIQNRNMKIIEHLLAAPSIEVNRTDCEGWTPLEEAVSKEDLKIVTKLLAASGINVNAPTHDHQTVLHKAVRN